MVLFRISTNTNTKAPRELRWVGISLGIKCLDRIPVFMEDKDDPHQSQEAEDHALRHLVGPRDDGKVVQINIRKRGVLFLVRKFLLSVDDGDRGQEVREESVHHR